MHRALLGVFSWKPFLFPLYYKPMFSVLVDVWVKLNLQIAFHLMRTCNSTTTQTKCLLFTTVLFSD